MTTTEPSIPLEVSTERMHALADKHIRRYENRLATDSPVVNRAECARYLSIWKRIRTAGTYEELDDVSQGEIIDAIESGE